MTSFLPLGDKSIPVGIKPLIIRDLSVVLFLFLIIAPFFYPRLFFFVAFFNDARVGLVLVDNSIFWTRPDGGLLDVCVILCLSALDYQAQR